MSTIGLESASNLAPLVALTTTNPLSYGILTTALTAPGLAPALTTPPSSSSPSLTDYLKQIEGTLAFNSGTLVSDLKTPLGNLQGSFDLKQLLSDASAYVSQVSGTLNLEGGIAAGTINLPGQSATGSFNFADVAGSYLNDLVTSINGPQPFENGVLQLNIPTQFGAVVGSVDFGTGKLITDLDTPVGKIQTTIDLPDTLAFSFNVSGVSGEVNLGKGQIISRIPVVGSEIAIPISSLSGNFDFDGGQVEINVPTPLGSISTTVDLATIIDDAVTSALTSATGTLSIADSKLGIDLVSSVGNFKGTIDVAELLKTYEPVLTQAQGTLTFKDGVLTGTLTTPQGNVVGPINYGQLLG
jgi:hypothetical protein